MKSHWTTWILVAATVLWLLLSGRLGLLMVVVPVSMVIGYVLRRPAGVGRNRI
jgi:hypothetical protein